MTYKLLISNDVKKKIKKMDKHLALMLAKDMKAKLDGLENPRSFGKALVGQYKGLWRYRIGAYRVICHIRDDELIVLAIYIGHRKDIYKWEVSKEDNNLYQKESGYSKIISAFWTCNEILSNELNNVIKL